MIAMSGLNKGDEQLAQDTQSSISTLAIESKRFDSEKIVRETRLFQELNTAYKWMSYVGLLYLQNTNETVNQQKSRKKTMYLAYQWFVDVLIVMNAFRHFALYRYLPDLQSFLVMFVTHAFLILLAVFSCMRPYLGKRISLFIVRIFSHKMNNQDESSINQLAKITRFYMFFICTYSLLFSIGFEFVAPPFYTEDTLVGQTYPFTKSSPFFYPTLLLFGFATTLGSLRVYMMLAHCFAVCHFLMLEYIHLAQTIRSRLTEIKDDDSFFLEACRTVFEALNDLLKHLNRISSISLMLVIFFCIFELCMVIYGLNQSIYVFHYYAISISAGFGMLYVVLLIGEGISLSSSAHQLADDLYAIDLRNLSSEASLKVSIFLSRLTSSTIGISVAGLFVIDHSTILTLTGTLLTYIIVVIQTNGSHRECSNNNITTPAI